MKKIGALIPASKRCMIAAMLLTAAPAPALSTNQCTRPRVPATGEGNTSCSASEANGRCTVDYNVFSERESRAAAFLSRAGISSVFVPDPRLDVVVGMAQLQGEPNKLTDAILIYLTVALSAQPAASDLTSVARQIAEAVRFPPVLRG